MKKSTLTAAVTALSLAGVLLLAAPAHAAGENVTNQQLVCDMTGSSTAATVELAHVAFYDVCLTSGEIQEVETANTDDGYDGFGLVATRDELGAEYIFTADTQENDGTTFTFVDTDVFNYLTDSLVDVHVVRTFIGNTVSWTVTVFAAGTSTPAEMPIYIYGNLGSDNDSVYRPQGATLLSYQAGAGDPLLLWKSTGEVTFTQGDDDPIFDFGTTSSASLQNIVVGYESCADVPTVAALVAGADANWAAYANSEIPEISAGACFETTGTTTFTRGVPVDVTLSVNDYGDFDWSSGGDASISALPAGLEVEVINRWADDGTRPSVRIFGTPTTVGATTGDLRLWDDYSGDATLPLTLTVVNEPVAADLALDALVGEVISGSDVSYLASGLQEGAAWTLTLRSTPQVIGQGFVTSTGIVSGVAPIPAGLEAGWHSVTLDSTDNTGATLTRVVYFEIGAAGQLMSSNYTGIPAATAATAVTPLSPELAATGFSGGTGALGALALTLAGALLFGAARRRRRALAAG